VIVPFTIRAVQRKARDSNPHSPEGGRFSKAVRQIRIRLPSTNARPTMDPPGVEPGSPPRQGGALPLGDEPVIFRAGSIPCGRDRIRPEMNSGPPGSRTPISGVRYRRRPVGPAARSTCDENGQAGESNPDLLGAGQASYPWTSRPPFSNDSSGPPETRTRSIRLRLSDTPSRAGFALIPGFRQVTIRSPSSARWGESFEWVDAVTAAQAGDVTSTVGNRAAMACALRPVPVSGVGASSRTPGWTISAAAPRLADLGGRSFGSDSNRLLPRPYRPHGHHPGLKKHGWSGSISRSSRNAHWNRGKHRLCSIWLPER
jgi:hypothetical protein